MAKIIAIGNQKGGVGKTSVSLNLAAAFARSHKVLIIDIDPQANTSDVLHHDYDLIEGDPHGHEQSIYATIIDRKPLRIHRSSVNNLDIVVSHLALAQADIMLGKEYGLVHERLKRALEDVQDKYDYILIDCPPSLGFLMINALVAADELIVVIKPGRHELQGIPKLLNTINDLIIGEYNHNLKLSGFLINMFIGRELLSQQTQENLEEMYGKEKVFHHKVPKYSGVGKATGNRMTIFEYDPDSNVSTAFNNLTSEITKQ